MRLETLLNTVEIINNLLNFLDSFFPAYALEGNSEKTKKPGQQGMNNPKNAREVVRNLGEKRSVRSRFNTNPMVGVNVNSRNGDIA